MTSKKPLLSAAFTAFVQHLTEDERERVTAARLASPLEQHRPVTKPHRRETD